MTQISKESLKLMPNDKDKFDNKIDLFTFNPVDNYMLVKSPFQKATSIIVKEKDESEITGDKPSLVIKVGQFVQDVEPGMEIYLEPQAPGIKVYREFVEGDVPVKKSQALVSISTDKDVPQTEKGIIGFYDYFIMDRNLVTGYRDLRK